MFNADSPTCKIKPSELGTTEALHWYGIIMQGSYGDNTSEAPTWFNLVDRLKWNSYENVKGMDKHEARVMFMDAAKKMLEERGFDIESPMKAKMEEEYAECVQEKLSSGVTQEEIDSESNNYSKKVASEKKELDESTPFDLKGMEYSYIPYSKWTI